MEKCCWNWQSSNLACQYKQQNVLCDLCIKHGGIQPFVKGDGVPKSGKRRFFNYIPIFKCIDRSKLRGFKPCPPGFPPFECPTVITIERKNKSITRTTCHWTLCVKQQSTTNASIKIIQVFKMDYIIWNSCFCFWILKTLLDSYNGDCH